MSHKFSAKETLFSEKSKLFGSKITTVIEVHLYMLIHGTLVTHTFIPVR